MRGLQRKNGEKAVGRFNPLLEDGRKYKMNFWYWNVRNIVG